MRALVKLFKDVYKLNHVSTFNDKKVNTCSHLKQFALLNDLYSQKATKIT